LELKSNFHPDLYKSDFHPDFCILDFFQPIFTRFLILKINTDKFPDFLGENKKRKR